jgi:hypothetical protein
MTSVLQRWFRLTVVMVTLVLGVAAAAAGGSVQAATASVSRGVAAAAAPAGVRALCAAPAPGEGTCAVVSATRSGAKPAAGAATPAGYSASSLRSAYAAPTTLGLPETVAVVTAYDDPHAESDMGTYRTQYSIPACTTANGCFKKVDQTGGSTYPPAAAGWSAADAESLDMISAICPNCHIILVEANSSQVSDFGAAENEAATLGADAIDNDWQTPEGTLGSGETGYDAQYFDHPGVAITAPAGDTGYGVDYPAASQYVTAVGGTTLTKNTSASRGWAETAWASTGSGCSAYEPKPWWQRDTGCSGRTLNDLSAVADPNTPVAFYDTPTLGGWNANSGGTAVAAAVIAGMYALGGTPAPGSYPSSYPYLHPGSFYAVTSGSNGTCSPAYLCTAGSGYNGPAGAGTPDAAAGFSVAGARPAAVTGTDGTTRVFVRGTGGSIEEDSLPSGSSTWSGFSSLGGNWPAYPAAITGTNGSIWVLAVSASGDLSYADLPSGSTTWSSWGDLGNPGHPLIGTPAVVQDSSGMFHIFVRDDTGVLYEDRMQNGSGTFSSLGGISQDDPAAVLAGSNTIYVFEVGWTTQMYYDKLPSGGSWSGWTSLGGDALGVPAAIHDTSGAVRVYVRRAVDWDAFENHLPSGSSTWSGFSSLGGALPSGPAAQAGSGGYDWAFALGRSTNLYFDELPPNGSYSGWTELNGAFTGTPGVTQNSHGGAMHVFSRTTTGSLDVNSLPSGSSTWTGYTSLGSQVAGS